MNPELIFKGIVKAKVAFVKGWILLKEIQDENGII